MKSYTCEKCGSVDVFIDDRGSQKALMCGDCGVWIKWVGKKELPLVERFIKTNSAIYIDGKIDIGDKVKNTKDGRVGIVVRVFKSGSIAVLENVAPTVINTHDSVKTLEIIEKHSIDIFDETKWVKS